MLRLQSDIRYKLGAAAVQPLPVPSCITFAMLQMRRENWANRTDAMWMLPLRASACDEDHDTIRTSLGCERARRRRDVRSAGQFGGAIRVAMTDSDVVTRLKSTTGLGAIYDLGRRASHHKNVWCWSVIRKENVRDLATELAPLLSFRRRLASEFIFHTDDMPMPHVQCLEPGTPEAWA